LRKILRINRIILIV